ncbi:hypothetical protein JNW90_23600 [Micromonospora sp. STR1s_5]|nr:hypothetical protein [Micromonospora sp. STR1s_5]
MNAVSRSQWSSQVDMGAPWYHARICQEITAIEAGLSEYMYAVQAGDLDAALKILRRVDHSFGRLGQFDAGLASYLGAFGGRR